MGVVQWIIFALPDRAPVVMELLAHAVDHLTENFSSGSTQFNLLQFQKVQCSCKKFLQNKHSIKNPKNRVPNFKKNQEKDAKKKHIPLWLINKL